MKDRLLHGLAYGWSILCYPLFVPTYTMVAFVLLFHHLVGPLPTGRILIASTVSFTCLIPLLILSTLIRLGKVQNLDVTRREERTLPYLVSLISLAMWAAVLFLIPTPRFLRASAVSTILILCLIVLVNLRWKISIHLCSMGSATALAISYILYFGLPATTVVLSMLLIAFLLMCARIYLQAHTPEQTVVGYLVGLLAVLIPNLLILL